MLGGRLSLDRLRSRDRAAPAVAVAALILLTALFCPAVSFAQAPKQETGTNWAGYAVTSRSPIQQVRGAWTQPVLTCGEQRSNSAFWVGLGGFKRHSHLLEQVGAFARCRNGRAEQRAFYELWPERGGPLRLDVRAGDQLAASVSVRGRTVSLQLTDLTTHEERTKVVLTREPDTSSAEWIAEVPGLVCGTNCLLVGRLANFGEVTFTEAEAASQDGGLEAISSPAFSATELLLRDKRGEATPGPLSPAGTSFNVTWQR
jgi:hypothetical protein